MPDQKWKKSSIGLTLGWAASRIILSDELNVARCVETRVNSIIAVRLNCLQISPISRMQSGVALKSSAVTLRFVTDGQ